MGTTNGTRENSEKGIKMQRRHTLHIFKNIKLGDDLQQFEFFTTIRKIDAHYLAKKELKDGAHSVHLISYPWNMSIKELKSEIKTTRESSFNPIQWEKSWRMGKLLALHEVAELKKNTAFIDAMGMHGHEFAVQYNDDTLSGIDSEKTIVYDNNMKKIFPPRRQKIKT